MCFLSPPPRGAPWTRKPKAKLMDFLRFLFFAFRVLRRGSLPPPPGSGVEGAGCSSPRSGENFATTTKVPQPIRIFTKTYLCHFVRELAMWHRGIVGGARSLLGGARRTADAHTVLLRPEYSSAPSVSNNLRSTTTTRSSVAVTSVVTTATRCYRLLSTLRESAACSQPPSCVLRGNLWVRRVSLSTARAINALC